MRGSVGLKSLDAPHVQKEKETSLAPYLALSSYLSAYLCPTVHGAFVVSCGVWVGGLEGP